MKNPILPSWFPNIKKGVTGVSVLLSAYLLKFGTTDSINLIISSTSVFIIGLLELLESLLGVKA